MQDKEPVSKADDDLEAVLAEASRHLEQTTEPVPFRAGRGHSPATRPAGELPPDDVLYCAYHPSVQTMLRCNRCGKPICTRCAVRTPVGYRCKQCVGQQQAVFFTGGTGDYVVGAVVAALAGGVSSLLMTLLGAWFFALILGPTVGLAISELVRLAVRRRRSRYLWLSVTVGMVLGALPALLLGLAGGNLLGLITPVLFLVLAVGSASARLR